MLERLERANRAGEQPRAEREPGWLHRRRRVQAPARAIVDGLPTGPAAATWDAGGLEGDPPAGGRNRR